jgi:hypothetical protein
MVRCRGLGRRLAALAHLQQGWEQRERGQQTATHPDQGHGADGGQGRMVGRQTAEEPDHAGHRVRVTSRRDRPVWPWNLADDALLRSPAGPQMRRLRVPYSQVQGEVEVVRAAAGSVVRAIVLSVEAAGQHRLLRLEHAVTVGDAAGESEDRDRKGQSPQRVQVVGPGSSRWLPTRGPH